MLSRICPSTFFGALAALTLLASNLHADIIETIRNKYNANAPISSELTLNIYWSVREKEETRTGELFLAPGDKFRVELDRSTWVCDGQTVWQYNRNTNQVIIKRLLDIDLSSHPSQILKRYLSDYEYQIREKTDRRAVAVWQADSSDAGAEYRAITVEIDAKRALIERLVTVDSRGNRAAYVFSDTEIGAEIPAETFTFTIPRGVDVLDTRE